MGSQSSLAILVTQVVRTFKEHFEYLETRKSAVYQLDRQP